MRKAKLKKITILLFAFLASLYVCTVAHADGDKVQSDGYTGGVVFISCERETVTAEYQGVSYKREIAHYTFYVQAETSEELKNALASVLEPGATARFVTSTFTNEEIDFLINEIRNLAACESRVYIDSGENDILLHVDLWGKGSEESENVIRTKYGNDPRIELVRTANGPFAGNPGNPGADGDSGTVYFASVAVFLTLAAVFGGGAELAKKRAALAGGGTEDAAGAKEIKRRLSENTSPSDALREKIIEKVNYKK